MINETIVDIAPEHPAFAGHFPGQPIVPGALLLALAMQAIEQAGISLRACTISSAKFVSAVRPGQAVRLQWEEGAANSLRFELLVADRRVASATLALRSAPSEESS